MYMIEEDESNTRPPLLDGTNFADWKPRMTAFLKSMDIKAWKAVIFGWEPPTIIGQIYT